MASRDHRHSVGNFPSCQLTPPCAAPNRSGRRWAWGRWRFYARPMKQCPKCSTKIQSDAWLCPCGYEFTTAESFTPSPPSLSPTQRRASRRQGLGCLLIVLPPLGVLLVYAVSSAWLASVAAAEPVPNQGAMVQASLAVIGAAAVALVFMTIGLWLFATNRIGRH